MKDEIVPHDRNQHATEPTHHVGYLPPVVRTNSRSHNSRLALAGLGVMAALVAVAGNAQPARPADAAVNDRAADRTIDEIDFTTVAQPGSTCTEGLDDTPPFLVVVDGGRSELLDEDSVTQIEVEPEVLYGDLDGDGADEAVVQVVCTYGANGAQDAVQVWTLSSRGGPVVVDRVTEAPDEVAEASAFPPGVADVALDGDELVVTFTQHADDDPNCCYSQEADVRYELDGDDLATVGSPVTGPVEP
jgi:hypothetical protein